jgi:hypothetical protein
MIQVYANLFPTDIDISHKADTLIALLQARADKHYRRDARIEAAEVDTVISIIEDYFARDADICKDSEPERAPVNDIPHR